jgi:hypothetical protein
MSIAIGVLRPDLVPVTRDSTEHMLRKNAKMDGHELDVIVELDSDPTASTRAVIDAVHKADAAIVYVPWRAHIDGISIGEICDHAAVTLIIDNLDIARRARRP